jgi:hypothetical protein
MEGRGTTQRPANQILVLAAMGMAWGIVSRAIATPNPPAAHEIATLLASDGQASDYLGCAVAISEDT